MYKVTRVLPWFVLFGGSFVMAALLKPFTASASTLVGAMVFAMVFGCARTPMRIRPEAFAFAQAITAVAIACTLDTKGLYETAVKGWMFVAVVLTIGCGVVVGWVLVRMRKLPGTTAAWGCLPGAASMMGALAEKSGGDGIRVTVMHYLRVVLVVATCPVVAAALAADGTMANTVVHATRGFEPSHSKVGAVAAILLAAFGCWVGVRARILAGAFFVPLALGAVCVALFPLGLHVPKPLLGGAFMVLGAAIGLQFRREHARPMLKSLPIMLVAVVTIVALCAVSAWLLTIVSPTSLLTAYLATSPGGLETVAAIAMGANVDMNFVIAVQTVRFFLVVMIGPWLAKAMANQFNAS